ncbi:MAG: phosphotransferase [Chloroflexi bacterium]|nr:phosphotransferase [Chloroflexota bacterium]
MKKTACLPADELARRMATAWQQRPPTGYGADITLQFHPPAHRHTYSCHYEFALRSGRRRTTIVVKVAHGARAADPAAEYAALQRLAQHFRPFPDLTVPQPLLVLAQPPALVMTKLPGQRLLHTVRRLRWRHRIPTEVCTRLQQAGRWLARLHQMPLLPAQRPALGAEERFQQAWVTLQNSRAAAATGDVIAAALQQRLPHMPVEPAVPLHGDYTLRNVLCHETRLAVLDTELAVVGPAELDVAAFVAALL